MNRKKKKGFDEPMRTCIGCREPKPKKDLIRIVLKGDDLSVDLTGKAPGRGVYCCRDQNCLEKLIKGKQLQRGFKRGFSDDVLEPVIARLREAIEQSL